jgi:hypothetical protein
MQSTTPYWNRGYAVLPPGHGKSYYHKQGGMFVEADSLVGCKSTPELARLRQEAKLSGSWDTYDKAWTEALEPHIPPGPVVIGVPDASLGKLLRANPVFSGVLAHAQWAENLKNRKGSVMEYLPYWEKVYAEGAEIYETNEDLMWALKVDMDDWWRTACEDHQSEVVHSCFIE